MIKPWQKTLLNQNKSILEVLKIINTEALRVAMVTDDNNKFIGIVTDGDVRRGLIRGVSLQDPVSNIVNKTPVVLPHNATRQEIVDKMKKLDILFIPLVDNGEIVGVETLHSALANERTYENPIFIMAGGFGTRLRPLTDTCPKPMLKVGDKPMLETLILSFKKLGFVNFYVSTHYMPEQIHSHFGNGSSLDVNITYVHEDIPLGTGGALGLLPSTMNRELPLILINGDVLTKVDFEKLLEFHAQNNTEATMCVREYDYQIPYGVVEANGNEISGMVEKPTHRYFVNAGIYVLSPEIYNRVSSNVKVDMPDILQRHIDDGKRVLMFPIHEYWLDIGRIDDFNRAQVDIKNLGLD